ncbi:hypothetical protein AAT19DRAFT_14494 [Rhodotorula toruloides]|uniref:Uncharacterized protein n=1 Tax=Rhodotorula toruloides TaxID=5286 RepID=A0A2T0A7Y4_RHOTO|nr:hypothetical protein AAT19DRAFT_14494 [Rhodotorula toruloides]
MIGNTLWLATSTFAVSKMGSQDTDFLLVHWKALHRSQQSPTGLSDWGKGQGRDAGTPSPGMSAVFEHMPLALRRSVPPQRGQLLVCPLFNNASCSLLGQPPCQVQTPTQLSNFGSPGSRTNAQLPLSTLALWTEHKRAMCVHWDEEWHRSSVCWQFFAVTQLASRCASYYVSLS